MLCNFTLIRFFSLVFFFFRIKEEAFWRNYFYRVSLIKQSTQLTSLAQETGLRIEVIYYSIFIDFINRFTIIEHFCISNWVKISWFYTILYDCWEIVLSMKYLSLCTYTFTCISGADTEIAYIYIIIFIIDSVDYT